MKRKQKLRKFVFIVAFFIVYVVILSKLNAIHCLNFPDFVLTTYFRNNEPCFMGTNFKHFFFVRQYFATLLIFGVGYFCLCNASHFFLGIRYKF